MFHANRLKNMCAFFRGANRGDMTLDAFLFTCDQKRFLKDGHSMTALWPGVYPRMNWIATDAGPRLLLDGAPFATMCDLEGDFNSDEFSKNDLGLMNAVISGQETPLDWNSLTIASRGVGADIDFLGFEGANFSPDELSERRRDHERVIEQHWNVEGIVRDCDKRFSLPPDSTILDIRDPASILALRRIFARYRFTFKGDATKATNPFVVVKFWPQMELVDEYAFGRGGQEREKALSKIRPKAPESYADWLASMENRYPRMILGPEEVLGGFETLAEAKKAAAHVDDRPWLIMLRGEVWGHRESLCHVEALPFVFKSPATAWRFMREHCGFKDEDREISVSVDGVDTLYVYDAPRRDNWFLQQIEWRE